MNTEDLQRVRWPGLNISHHRRIHRHEGLEASRSLSSKRPPSSSILLSEREKNVHSKINPLYHALERKKDACSMSSSMVKMNGNANSNKAANNIWQVMNYQVPRGKCVHKVSMLSSSCPCLRFMLNPLQASSSFTCDGCGHHASFHALRNPGEEYNEETQANGTVVNGNVKGLSTSIVGRKRSAAVAEGSVNGSIGRRRIMDADEDGDVDVDRDVQIIKRSRN